MSANNAPFVLNRVNLKNDGMDTIPFYDKDKFKDAVLVDIDNGNPLCLIVGEERTTSNTRAHELIDELSATQEQTIVYNFATINFKVEIEIFSKVRVETEYLVGKNYTKIDLLDTLHQDEDLRNIFVESFKKTLEKNLGDIEGCKEKLQEILNKDVSTIIEEYLPFELVKEFKVLYNGSAKNNTLLEDEYDYTSTFEVKFSKGLDINIVNMEDIIIKVME
ncbi:hypothetical protein BX667DRAFT_505633 [Coemansia mojavensis]|nr:hypothetical protein BX667DRAFT_505633 [Coemansia mojavensis]